MYLGNFNDIKEKRKHLPFIFKMNCPCDKCMVVGRRSSVCRKMQLARMILKELSDTVTALQK